MEKTVRNILVLTTWEYKSGLIQSSTLPYLRMIHNIVPSAKIHLHTQEKTDWYKDEKDEVVKQLTPHNIQLHAQVYQRFGLRKMVLFCYQFLRLLLFVIKNDISHIH